ncbi:hypothetical protein NQ318_017373 [Aromia moschata]|uniref:GIY-YIG domain-containing protein n=1 Tax=Aromia moschata TaxID=1265417 RepID=A0AAV8Z4W3_9CUCU|nr:hypothetical protein NQ318_017373 [Aromia moschata]
MLELGDIYKSFLIEEHPLEKCSIILIATARETGTFYETNRNAGRQRFARNVNVEERVLNRVWEDPTLSTRRVCRTYRTRVEQQPTTYACLPYVAGVTDKLKNKLSKKNIGVRFRTVKKIQQVLPTNKDPVPRLLTKGVYELKCTYGKSYIGQTGRSIQCRIKEHQRHSRLGNTDKSAIAEHVHTNENHKIDYENIRVLNKTTRYYPRIIRESLEIIKNNNNFNREDGYRLSN